MAADVTRVRGHYGWREDARVVPAYALTQGRTRAGRSWRDCWRDYVPASGPGPGPVGGVWNGPRLAADPGGDAAAGSDLVGLKVLVWSSTPSRSAPRGHC
jgi:hypothetical protein